MHTKLNKFYFFIIIIVLYRLFFPFHFNSFHSNYRFSFDFSEVLRRREKQVFNRFEGKFVMKISFCIHIYTSHFMLFFFLLLLLSPSSSLPLSRAHIICVYFGSHEKRNSHVHIHKDLTSIKYNRLNCINTRFKLGDLEIYNGDQQWQ